MLPNRNTNVFRSNEKSVATSAFMSKVYLWMMVGIAMSGITALVVSHMPLVFYIIQNRGVFIGLIIFQVVSVIALSGFVERMSVRMAATVYALYATLVGLSFSTLFFIYTSESISAAFFTTAFSFAGLSIFGATTKRDLGPVGSFCMMGLFGLIGVVLLGLLFPSMMNNGMQLAMSVIGTIIFAGLTAYDTQRIKSLQWQFTTPDQARKGAIYGALILYLDFINLFLNILRLFGSRR
jgi:FtsH-binding integral membrane protein